MEATVHRSLVLVISAIDERSESNGAWHPRITQAATTTTSPKATGGPISQAMGSGLARASGGLFQRVCGDRYRSIRSAHSSV